MLIPRTQDRVYRVGHIACSIGAGAAGFNDAEARVENVRARFECAGGIDVDPMRIRNFDMMTGANGTVLDLFSRAQYEAYHGHEPPSDWREATPDDMRRAFGGDVDVIFSSPPCRGMTSLLDPSLAPTDRYQALNQLTVRSTMLAMEAFRDSLKIFLLENVPGLGTRGRPLLNQIVAVLRANGFSVSEEVHDCGEVGGLAQHRKRFLLVARQMDRVPPFLYRPRKQRMKTLGEVIGRLPLPGDPLAGPMHRIPELAWKTWKRLAFVEPGRDWRSLQDLRAVDGVLADWGIAPVDGAPIAVADPTPAGYPHHQVYGVRPWDMATGTVAGASRPSNGAYAVADPRYDRQGGRTSLGVRPWNASTGTVTGNTHPSNGAFSVADVRAPFQDGLPTYAVVPIGSGAPIANPAPTGGRGGRGKYRVTGMDEQSGTVISSSTTGEGAYAVADPTAWPVLAPDGRLPDDETATVARIIARDGTWHRPLTCLELAALQSLVPDDLTKPFALHGSETAARAYIGDAVPRAAAKAMAETILQTLVLADLGTTFELSSEEIWATPLAVALSVDQTATGGALDIERRLGA